VTSIVNSKLNYPRGDLAVWAFIYAELLVFSLFFVGYAFARMLYPAEFSQGQQTLNPVLGLVNTVFLLTSGWLVAAAVLALIWIQTHFIFCICSWVLFTFYTWCSVPAYW